MEEFIVQTYFTDVERCKYIFEYDIPRTHCFSSKKASIPNKCSVKLANLLFEQIEYLILKVIWTRPHYFIINTKNHNIMWTEGRKSDDIKFKRLYTVITSLSKWIQNLIALAEEEVIISWVRSEQYIKAKYAKKKLSEMGLTST